MFNLLKNDKRKGESYIGLIILLLSCFLIFSAFLLMTDTNLISSFSSKMKLFVAKVGKKNAIAFSNKYNKKKSNNQLLDESISLECVAKIQLIGTTEREKRNNEIKQETESTAKLYPITKELKILSLSQTKCPKVPIFKGNFAIRSALFDDVVLQSSIETLLNVKKYYPLLYAKIKSIYIQKDWNVKIILDEPFLKIDLSWNWGIHEIRKLHASLEYLKSNQYENGYLDLRNAEALYWLN